MFKLIYKGVFFMNFVAERLSKSYNLLETLIPKNKMGRHPLHDPDIPYYIL